VECDGCAASALVGTCRAALRLSAASLSGTCYAKRTSVDHGSSICHFARISSAIGPLGSLADRPSRAGSGMDAATSFFRLAGHRFASGSTPLTFDIFRMFNSDFSHSPGPHSRPAESECSYEQLCNEASPARPGYRNNSGRTHKRLGLAPTSAWVRRIRRDGAPPRRGIAPACAAAAKAVRALRRRKHARFRGWSTAAPRDIGPKSNTCRRALVIF